MPITELVYTIFKPDSPSEATVPKALEHLAGVNGLLLLKHGKVLQVDGADVPAEKSSILTLEWEETSQFETFIKSDNYVQFATLLKPMLAAPPTPQLYEADTRSISCTSAVLTQIFKLKLAGTIDKNAIQSHWQKLVQEVPSGNTFHAWGGKNAEGEFLGLIGWPSIEAYRSGNDSSQFKARLEELKKSGSLTTMSVQYPK